MLNRKGKKIGAVLLTMVMALGLLTGCGGNSEQKDGSAKAENTSVKVFTYGDTTFNAENDESDVNPHRGYSGCGRQCNQKSRRSDDSPLQG